MSASIKNIGRSGFTLVEMMVVMAVVSVLGLLLSSSFGYITRFYGEVSVQSRRLGAATLVMDKVENACFGLPKQAMAIDGNYLVIHPLETLGATGEAVYSSERYVVESSPKGVYWWVVTGQSRDLVSPLEFALSEPGPNTLRRKLLGEGWRLEAEFVDGRFPLKLKLSSPEPDTRTFERTVSGYL